MNWLPGEVTHKLHGDGWLWVAGCGPLRQMDLVQTRVTVCHHPVARSEVCSVTWVVSSEKSLPSLVPTSFYLGHWHREETEKAATAWLWGPGDQEGGWCAIKARERVQSLGSYY